MRNVIFNQLTKATFLQTKRIVRVRVIAFAMLLIVLSISNVFSQVDKQKNIQKNDSEAIEIQKILEVQDYIQYLKSNEIANNLTYLSSKRLMELLYKPQSSLYFYSGVTKRYGEKFTNLYIDVSSLRSFSDSDEYNNIEIITIYINTSNEQTQYIDLNLFNNLKKLKYVYIIGKSASTEGQITKMVMNLIPKYGVFYKIPRDDNY